MIEIDLLLVEPLAGSLTLRLVQDFGISNKSQYESKNTNHAGRHCGSPV